MALIDSNIWCYYFDQSAKEHKKVSDFLEKMLKKEHIITNTVILLEVSHFLVKNLGPRIGKEKIETLLAFPMEILDLDIAMLEMSVDLLSDYSHLGIGGRDSTLLATLKKTKMRRIITHDASFKKIDWVDAVDPVQA